MYFILSVVGVHERFLYEIWFDIHVLFVYRCCFNIIVLYIRYHNYCAGGIEDDVTKQFSGYNVICTSGLISRVFNKVYTYRNVFMIRVWFQGVGIPLQLWHICPKYLWVHS